jgi:glycosyltransferase involved in cell wall biosynthesis
LNHDSIHDFYFTLHQENQGMDKISAVIITFNEERHITACIESVLLVADEVLVIDSGSTDRTAEICGRLGARFIPTPWQGYSGSKNYGNQLADHNWILSLDADEQLSDDLIESILEEKNSFKADAYLISRMTRYCNQWIKFGGWYPDRKIRLWDRRKGSWQGTVHEEVVMNPDSKTGKLKGDILHFSIDSIEQHQQQINTYSTLYARHAFENGRRTTIWAMLFKPFGRFIVTYLLKAGFLDGMNGFLIAWMSAHGIFLRHAKLRQMYAQRINKYPDRKTSL